MYLLTATEPQIYRAKALVAESCVISLCEHGTYKRWDAAHHDSKELLTVNIPAFNKRVYLIVCHLRHSSLKQLTSSKTKIRSYECISY